MSSPISGRPLPSSFDDDEDFYNESGFNKILRRLKREPLVPLGCLLTVAAFTNAYRAMRKGDHHQVQRMFRARVLAQAFTLVAVVAGGIYFGAERNQERELWKLKQNQKAEEKRTRWIRELEVRDEEEKELRAMIQRRREKNTTAVDVDARHANRTLEAKGVEAVGGEAKEGAAVSESGEKPGDAAGKAKQAPPEGNASKAELADRSIK